MGNLTIAVTFVCLLNLLMFMAQAATMDLNEDSPIFYNCTGTVTQTYISGDCQQISMPNTDSLAGELPISTQDVQGNTGIYFIDALNSLKEWINNKLDYFGAIVSAPYSMLKAIPGLPDAFVGILGTLWYMLTIFLIAAFILGRE